MSYPWKQAALRLCGLEARIGHLAAALERALASEANGCGTLEAQLGAARDAYRLLLAELADAADAAAGALTPPGPAPDPGPLPPPGPGPGPEPEPDLYRVMAVHRANAWGEPCYVLDRDNPARDAPGRSPFVVLESMSTAWERENARLKVYPGEKP